MSAVTDLEREEAWRLYELGVRLVEAQIDRQWSMTQAFVLLNASVIGGAIALLEFSSSRLMALLVVFAFLAGIGLSFAALSVLRQNKRYYRTLVAKKTLLEERLGFTGPVPGHESMGVATWSMGAVATRNKVRRILRDPDAYRNGAIRRGSLTDWAGWTFVGFALFDAIGIVLIGNTLWGCGLTGLPCTPL